MVLFILDFLNEEFVVYFENVKKYLNVLEILFEIDLMMVCGLDYYNYMIFEIMSVEEGFGVKIMFCGGGRYYGLVREFGGLDILGMGFGIGVECILLVLEKVDIKIFVKKLLEVYVIIV